MTRRILANASKSQPILFVILPALAVALTVRLGHVTGTAVATVVFGPSLAVLAVLRKEYREHLPSFADATREFVKNPRLPPLVFWMVIAFPLSSLALTLNFWFPPTSTSDANLILAASDAIFLPVAGLSLFALLLKLHARKQLKLR